MRRLQASISSKTRRPHQRTGRAIARAQRDAKSQRDLLESYLAKYREATSRDTINSTPADARVISRATVSNVPAYPKKLPTVLIATFATLVLSSGLVMTKEILSAPGGSCRCASIRAVGTARHWRRDMAALVNEPPRPPAARGVPQLDRQVAYDLRQPAAPATGSPCSAPCRGQYQPDRDQARPRARRRFARRAGRAGFRRHRDQGDLDRTVGRRARRACPRRGHIRRHHHQGQTVAAALDLGGTRTTDRVGILPAPGMVTNFEALAHSYDHVVVDAGKAAGPEIDRVAEIAPHAVLVAETRRMPQRLGARAAARGGIRRCRSWSAGRNARRDRGGGVTRVRLLAQLLGG